MRLEQKAHGVGDARQVIERRKVRRDHGRSIFRGIETPVDVELVDIHQVRGRRRRHRRTRTHARTHAPTTTTRTTTTAEDGDGDYDGGDGTYAESNKRHERTNERTTYQPTEPNRTRTPAYTHEYQSIAQNVRRPRRDTHTKTQARTGEQRSSSTSTRTRTRTQEEKERTLPPLVRSSSSSSAASGCSAPLSGQQRPDEKGQRCFGRTLTRQRAAGRVRSPPSCACGSWSDCAGRAREWSCDSNAGECVRLVRWRPRFFFF